MDGRPQHMERIMMMNENTNKESPKRQINTNHPPDLVTLAPDYVNGQRRSMAKR
jgi:hypothetical protein